MRKTFGIFAHVDAGKTTLSEQLLFKNGARRTRGSVDEKNTCTDYEDIEKARGITVFSTVARFENNENEYFLIDTPGHSDFSAEVENVLSVLDFALLCVSGTEGVQPHTKTLWKLLKSAGLPVFLFVNKTDRDTFNRQSVLSSLQKSFGDGVVDFADGESVAAADDVLLEKYLAGGCLDERLVYLIQNRRLFPCLFGSALTGSGVDALTAAFDKYIKTDYCDGALQTKLFKVRRDSRGNRLCFMKILRGTLAAKDCINGEKINEIRIYGGEKYEAVQRAVAGQICAVTGLSEQKPESTNVLLPTLRASVVSALPKPLLYERLKILEDENPLLDVSPSLEISIMGEIQLEVLQEEFLRRFGEKIEFSDRKILYKETLSAETMGLGHYEPLRHYAEVVLKMEPAPRGSGIEYCSAVSTDLLDKNFQNLIYTHIFEKEHIGVLTGSPITDIKITLIAAKAHLKHTEGGDFREATYRAIRQGLRGAQCALLEPFYSFTIDVPQENIGRVLSDLQRMGSSFSPPAINGESAVVEGVAAVSVIMNYQKDITAFSKGQGSISLCFYGYDKCKNSEEVIAQAGYNADADAKNPCGSIFCAKGAGFYVAWNEVKNYLNSQI